MSVDIGIIGLPQSGKTTIFNGLTGGRVDTASYHPGSLSPHLGTAHVPEPRLEVLAEMLHPEKVIPTEVKYIDVGASLKSLVEKKGIGGELLNQLSSVSALINVVRAFRDDSIPHVAGSLDVDRDITAMNLELTFSDLAIIERRLQKLEISLKGAKPPERQSFIHEQEMLARIKRGLENDTPIRELSLGEEDARAISHYQFLTAKPLLIVVNIGEERLPEAASLESELAARYAQPKRGVITLCGKLEMELAQLDEDAAAQFRTEFGITQSGLGGIIKLSYELLGLISFFTTASGEVKAWPITKGTTALKAAGKIHSDMERGFIRAEVISYTDLVTGGSVAEARRQGYLRQEGKNYSIQDGDVITFLFNV